jgi:hypothetical protein
VGHFHEEHLRCAPNPNRLSLLSKRLAPPLLRSPEKRQLASRGEVRGLHLGSGSAMKLCSTRLGYLWLEAARSGPQQAEGEPSDEEEVNSAPHDRFPKLESVPCVCFHHTAEGENERPEWSVGRWVSASFLPCHSVEVFLNEFGSPFGRRVILGGYKRQRGGLGILRC